LNTSLACRSVQQCTRDDSACQFRFSRVLTVIERATFVTGPYAAALLAYLGARVIKIESPPAGDSYRYFASPVHYEDLAKEKANPPPLRGEHSGKILSELGFRDETIRDLRSRGITRVS
jgi:crotonobetainyl-CoA:carnitine CoA-transferase CaiB-like acyl-CoA transferase